MRRIVGSRIVVACAALALSSAACNRNAAKTDQARGHVGAPINLTGCLQKEGGITKTYVLTQVNEPSQAVGTSGAAGNVEQERMREAKHAYRLDGDNDQLEQLVGKQVKLEGTIAENSDLNRPKDAKRDKPADIDSGDLAKVDVVTIAATADTCGGERK
jgi:hypothetical protein